jgi:hypothetical protein
MSRPAGGAGGGGGGGGGNIKVVVRCRPLNQRGEPLPLSILRTQ